MHRAWDVEAHPPLLPGQDSRAFAAFAREHETALLAKALHLCGNRSDARDLVQDTFERGLRSFSRFQAGTNGRAWLLTILHNLFIDRCRAKAREGRPEPSSDALEESATSVPAPESEEGPAWTLITPEQLREALGKLNADFRTVYQLQALEGRSYQQIAEALGISRVTVGTRLIRARRRLKELLMPKREEDGE